ncbi:DUF4157 domain-containing protein [uncultured Lacinutrix sp.]|uniref:eCIS core domain-containing protein n=1 Tax=uncultured Lacinutrix sp. TaxID=574032 RepID=UPI00260E5CA4|nr:DUF4157 domain-containing protein [uncultured Lacinutrix sp.]
MKNKSSNQRRRIRRQKPAQKQVQNDNFFESQVQRKCEKCEDEEKKGVQKKSNGETKGSSKSFFGHYMNNIGSKGNGMSIQNRAFFEGKMQDNFGDVKLHKDKEAASAAKEIGAKAFTYKNHIVLNKAHFEAGSIEEKKLMAHELKHVQQQKNGRHVIQMMPEEESTEPTKEENEQQTKEEDVQEASEADNVMMEKEAEQEEERIMTPESVPDFQTFGMQTTKRVYANSVTFEGSTDATFDGGIGSTRNLTRTPSEDCVGCAENDCYHYTGQLQIDYHVATSVTLPDVPEGLTDCQHERVRNAIDNVLAPHEQDHVTAFNQYNGTVTLAIDYTGCSAGIQEFVQQLHETNEVARKSSAQSASDALDPFHISVDMDCEDQTSAAPPEEPVD